MLLCLFSLGILDPSSQEVMIEKPRASETRVPSEQLLPVKEVNEERRGVVFYQMSVSPL